MDARGKARGGAGSGGSGPDGDDSGAAALDDYVDAVLSIVESIPPARAMTYGAIADYLGRGGPRQVGTVMAHYGGAVPWHRVVNASGRLVPGHEVEALQRHRAEGTPMRGPDLDRVDLRIASWAPPGST